jgi:DNA-binding Lrp family transcriptional regulator
MTAPVLDAMDRAILNRLQDGFPLSERPYLEAAQALGIEEDDLIGRLQRLLDERVLTRLGPLFQIERAGGLYMLAAMRVPAGDLERVIDIVNAHPEVAHNYLREHDFNLWFVLAADHSGRIDEVISRIERRTGHPVYAMPKLKEYFLDLRFRV